MSKRVIGFQIDTHLSRKQQYSGDRLRATWSPCIPSISLHMWTKWLTGSVFFNCLTSLIFRQFSLWRQKFSRYVIYFIVYHNKIRRIVMKPFSIWYNIQYYEIKIHYFDNEIHSNVLNTRNYNMINKFYLNISTKLCHYIMILQVSCFTTKKCVVIKI